MKFRYYLRGIGIGIVFTAIIVLVVYSNNIPQRMTDEDVIRRAKQLGMVEADDPISKLIDKTSETSDSESSATEELTSEKTTEQSTEKATEQTTEQTTEKTTEKKTEQTTEKTTEKKTDDDNDSASDNSQKSEKNKETVEITIDRGSSSFPVCQKLEELGMIDNAAKFDDYLIENGYADRISVGKHKLTKGMDYHEIAELISDPLE